MLDKGHVGLSGIRGQDQLAVAEGALQADMQASALAVAKGLGVGICSYQVAVFVDLGALDKTRRFLVQVGQ